MKILFLQHEGKLWGTARSLLALIDQLRLKGHKAYVLMHEQGGLSDELKSRSIPYTVCSWRVWLTNKQTRGVRRSVHGLRCLLNSRRQAPKMLDAIGDFNPNIVHSNTIKTDLGAQIAGLLGIPHIWHCREFVGGVYSVGTEWSLGRYITAHLMSSHSAAVIAVSRTLRQHLITPTLNLPIHVVYNGVMTAEAMRRCCTKVPPIVSRPCFATICRFDNCKEPWVPIQAVNVLKTRGIPCKLIMAGEGTREQKAMLTDIVHDGNLQDCVEFPGYVADVSALLKKVHALVMPSRGDAFGRVTAEAMAHGRPVIGADACATPELVRDGIDGLIFQHGDKDSLANKMMELIQSPERMKEMGSRAALRAQAEFSNEKYAGAIMKIYEDLLKYA